MIGDGFGIGWPHPDIDQGDTTMSLAQQMIRGHLRLMCRCSPRVTALSIIDNIAGVDQGGVPPLGLLHLFFGPSTKLIHIKLIVGKKDEIMEKLWTTRGVRMQTSK